MSGLCFRLVSRVSQEQQFHTFRFETLSEDLPVVVEIVDTTEKLEHFLEQIEPHVKAGLVTLEKAQIKFYRFES